MDIQRFFKLLKRYTWLLILIPVIAVFATYFFARDLPQEYRSDALVSTGLADHSQRTLVGGNQMDYFAINQQFENIIEFLKMKKNVNSLSFKLVLHDLENPNEAFSEIPESIIILGDVGRKAIIEEYKKFLIEGKIVTPEDNKEYMLFDYIQLMGYGESAILNQLEISRKDNSDFIKVEYLSNNPYLSVYVVNTVASDFINSYEERSNINKNSSKELLDSLLRGKEASMNAKNNQIKDFQVQNSVIDLGGQAEQIFAQIGLKDALRATTVSQIQSLQGAIQGIEEKLKNKNSTLVSSNATENTQIVTLRNQLQKANERYVRNNFKPEDARTIDSLQMALSKLNAGNPSSTGSDPKIIRQALIQQKLTMEIELDKAKSGLTATMNDLAQMRAQFNRMVPDNAGMKNYEREAEVATKEYLSALEMYNQNNVQGSTSSIRPQLAQVGVVNPPEQSKIPFFMGLAGIGSLGTSIFAFAIAFLLDRKIRTSDQLAVATHKRIVGQINNIVPNNTDLKTVWEEGKSTKDYSLYKDLIRSLRFEIDTSLKADSKQIIGVTSLFDQAGSSFISSSLAYSFAMTKKRVLLIGGDYVLDKSAEVKKIVDDQLFDSFIIKRELHTDEFITKLTTNAKNESLLEVYDEDVLRTGFEELKKEFDVIIIDIQSLQKIHRAKEWLMFADKSIALYPAGAVIGSYEKELIAFINKQDGFIGWVLNKTKASDLGLLKMAQLN